MATTVARYEALHILFPNAGFLIPGRVHEMPLDVWRRHLDVNLTGGFIACKYAVPAIKASGGGSILLTGSTASLVGEPNDAAYVASKDGVLVLAKAMAIDDAQSHAKLIDTFVPAGRQGLPDEVAKAAVFLVSDEASYLNGHAMVVDGGLTRCEPAEHDGEQVAGRPRSSALLLRCCTN